MTLTNSPEDSPVDFSDKENLIHHSEFIESKEECNQLQAKYMREFGLTPLQAYGVVVYTYGLNISIDEYTSIQRSKKKNC